MAARRTHTPEVPGSSPGPATYQPPAGGTVGVPSGRAAPPWRIALGVLVVVLAGCTVSDERSRCIDAGKVAVLDDGEVVACLTIDQLRETRYPAEDG